MSRRFEWFLVLNQKVASSSEEVKDEVESRFEDTAALKKLSLYLLFIDLVKAPLLG